MGGYMENISADRVREYINKDKWILVDVREHRYFVREHITDAINMPSEELLSNIDKLQRNVGYVIYCQNGSHSILVAKHMAENGHNVKNVIGGINAYKRWRRRNRY